MNKGDSQKKEVGVDYGSRRIVCNSRAGMAAGSQSRKLKGYIFSHMEKAERTSRKWDKGYKLQKVTLSDTLPLQDPTSSKSHQLPKRCHQLRN